MKRRDFIALVGGAAGWPLVARGQSPPKVHRIAVVHPSARVGDMSETGDNSGYRALFQELRRLGYVEGQNLVVERYSAEGGGQKRYAELAPNIVHTKPDLIFATSNILVLSFKMATDAIPVVGLMGGPVDYGIVASLARPGGNITGVTLDAGQEMWAKRLQILREAVPTASRVGLLISEVGPWDTFAPTLQEAARQAGISLLGPALESPVQETEYRRVLGAMVQQRADGLIVSDQSVNATHRRLIVDLVEKARLPAIYPFREHVEIGGLMAYAHSTAELWRRLAGYIDQILRGAKPGETPIYQASKLELLLNLKAAKALGLTFPPGLLARADEVIE
jgi:putative tryptophan/tyrosine transport system substrate-binding protein